MIGKHIKRLNLFAQSCLFFVVLAGCARQCEITSPSLSENLNRVEVLIHRGGAISINGEYFGMTRRSLICNDDVHFASKELQDRLRNYMAGVDRMMACVDYKFEEGVLARDLIAVREDFESADFIEQNVFISDVDYLSLSCEGWRYPKAFEIRFYLDSGNIGYTVGEYPGAIFPHNEFDGNLYAKIISGQDPRLIIVTVQLGMDFDKVRAFLNIAHSQGLESVVLRRMNVRVETALQQSMSWMQSLDSQKHMKTDVEIEL